MKLYCYKVTVDTTNVLKDCFTTKDGENDSEDYGEYLDCEGGEFYVVTDKAGKIHDKFGPNIISVERLGVAHSVKS